VFRWARFLHPVRDEFSAAGIPEADLTILTKGRCPVVAMKETSKVSVILPVIALRTGGNINAISN
jgi:hypothetical protein